MDAITAVCSAPAGGRTGELRVASTLTLEPELTARLLPEFARDQQAVRVRVIRCEGRDAIGAVIRDGRADVALTDLPVPGDLAAHPLEQREIVLICPPALQVREPVPVSALDGMRLIMPARGGARRAELEALLTRLGVAPVAAVESDDRGSWLPSVRAGRGSLLWYRNQVETADGVTVRSFAPPIMATIGLVHARRALTPVARDFLIFAKSRG
ncbi:LysR family transcriptional regulator substrate-binding protein [Actinoallomurus sp. WRP9H-5]|nr:LysR family transcriptional regulator substrate-binding protein [Actinoallomurus rhizosphaericola]